MYGHRLREQKTDRTLADVAGCKLVLECRDDPGGGGVERKMLLSPSEIENRRTLQFVRGNVIRAHFLGVRHGFADGTSRTLEYALNGPRSHDVLVKRGIHVFACRRWLGMGKRGPASDRQNFAVATQRTARCVAGDRATRAAWHLVGAQAYNKALAYINGTAGGRY